MININNPADCCGCTACAAICPHKAIAMIPDSLGFLYPTVNVDLCTNCGICEKVCAFNDHYCKSLNLERPLAFAVRHKDMNQIETSRSGAAFIALSDYILEQGGVVYGVGYKDHFKIAHKRAITKEQRDEFKGSKYVQSDLTGIFRQVKEDLRSGLMVLFSGTPCQTAGLNSYIGDRLRLNLFLVDIVCHGVPSPYIWRDYLAYQEKKHGIKFTSVNFRDKLRLGWKAHKESFRGDNFYGIYSSWTYLFYKHIMFRHSCGICHYTNLKRPSDVTIADYWGWQKTDKDFNKDDKGCSLVLCNTLKGVEWFNKTKPSLRVIPAELKNCMQPNLQYPSKINPNRMAFELAYKNKGFEYVAKKYGDLGWQYKIEVWKQLLKSLIKRIIGKK